jgi:hypothetical protein
LVLAALSIGVISIIVATQAEEALTLLTMEAIVRRVRMHAEISVLTVLGAVCSTCCSGWPSPLRSRTLRS